MKTLITALLASFFLISCSQKPESTLNNENNLAAQIEYADKMNNKVVFESTSYKMILFAMKKGQELKPHSAPVDAPMLMLEGQTKVTIGDDELIISKGDIITLPKDLMHGVYPITDCKFLLLK